VLFDGFGFDELDRCWLFHNWCLRGTIGSINTVAKALKENANAYRESCGLCGRTCERRVYQTLTTSFALGCGLRDTFGQRCLEGGSLQFGRKAVPGII